MDLGLEGKIALITGGSEGIGKATASALASEGASVVICARRRSVLAKAANKISADSSSPVTAIPTDVANPIQIDELIEKVIDLHGRIDILISNAGQGANRPFELLGDDRWQVDMDVKLYASIRLARLVIPHMKNNGGGRIVIVTNADGKAPGPGSLPASVTRASGIALTKALSKDFAHHNILVNTVCVGFIKSGQNDRRGLKEIEHEPHQTLSGWYRSKGPVVPLGRVGEAREAADLITFLVSEPASYITGSAVNIDGGLCATV